VNDPVGSDMDNIRREGTAQADGQNAEWEEKTIF